MAGILLPHASRRDLRSTIDQAVESPAAFCDHFWIDHDDAWRVEDLAERHTLRGLGHVLLAATFYDFKTWQHALSVMSVNDDAFELYGESDYENFYLGQQCAFAARLRERRHGTPADFARALTAAPAPADEDGLDDRLLPPEPILPRDPTLRYFPRS